MRLPTNTRRVMLLAALITACTTTAPTIVPGPNPLAKPCPTVARTVDPASLPGWQLTNLTLTCGGDGSVAFSNIASPARGTPIRYIVTVPDSSVIDGVVNSVDARGVPGVWPTDVHITFGMQYTADEGQEPNSTRMCILRSKVVYSQFDPGPNLVVSLGQDSIKMNLHRFMDDALIQSIYSVTPGRCARWTQMVP